MFFQIIIYVEQFFLFYFYLNNERHSITVWEEESSITKLLNGVLNVLMIWKKNEEKKKENEKEEKIKIFIF